MLGPAACRFTLWSLAFLFLSCEGLYISGSADSLHHVLSEFGLVRPVSTDAEGRFLSHSVSAHHLHVLPTRTKRRAPDCTAPPTTQGAPPTTQGAPPTTQGAPPTTQGAPPTTQGAPPRGKGSGVGGDGGMKREQEKDRGGGAGHTLYYNVTIFGREFHLRLRRNSRLVAPGAVLEWQREAGGSERHPLLDTHCFYSGDISNLRSSNVAISNCDGLAGMIRTEQEEFFIEPLERGRAEDGERERGREHIVYRSSAIIKQQPANQMPDHLQVLSGSFLDSVLNLSSNSTRHRRYIEGAEHYNIEVLLGVDYSVVLFHGRDHIQRYLLTLMNIVNEVYQDRSLGENINVVLVRIIILSSSKSLELIEVGNPSHSLQNVCGWAFLQQGAALSEAEHHDHAVYLTRQEFGPSGMQGYAPVTGMCHPVRSCALIQDDGFSSAFVVAHETGHVLGMEHDGEVNDCADEVPLGSIMAPLVRAMFHRYHWSSCSRQELQQHLHSYDCLRDDPFHSDWPLQPQLPGLFYSLEEQCRFDFGSDFSICTTYSITDPCKQLWCSHHDNPFFCKTKKGPPLDGTPCGQGKNCFKGQCVHVTSDLLRQDGGWGAWSPFRSCSRTCGGGVQFRTRHCDSPPPANRGRYCFGNSFEFQLCSLEEDCPRLTDFRAEQCQTWDLVFTHNGTNKHHWAPHNAEPEDNCQLRCQSLETGEVVFMNTLVHDGTRCSYRDPYSVCVKGDCEHVGCDQQVASERQDDQCGVCGGNNSTCRTVRGRFSRSARKQGYLKILEIPKGAHHLVVKELRGSPHVLALKNLVRGNVFLNAEGNDPHSRVVIEGGVAWEYSTPDQDHDQETVQTRGPLPYGVLVLVRSHGESKVTVSYQYVVQQVKLDNNLLQDDSVFYQWVLKRWTDCSKPCGGGRRHTRFGCRRRADGVTVPSNFCSNTKKLPAISQSCNTHPCSSARWESGAWGPCSSSCGNLGVQRRWVRCLQESSGGRQRSAPSRLCPAPRPEGRRSCNRTQCPASWRAGPWSQCSVTCGEGLRQRQVLCGSHPENYTLCTGSKPESNKTCLLPPCDQKNSLIQWLSRSSLGSPPQPSSKQRCRGDQSAFCRMEVLSRYCSLPGYSRMCCRSCSHANFTSRDNVSMTTQRWSSSPSWTVMPASTSGGHSTDFVYVNFDDYEESSAAEESGGHGPSGTPEPSQWPPGPWAGTPGTWSGTSAPSGTPTVPFRTFQTATGIPSTTGAVPSATTVRWLPTAPTMPPAAVAVVTRGPAPTPPGPEEKRKENNAVEEGLYRIHGLDPVLDHHIVRVQNRFVARNPQTWERTRNKRIQEVLRKKKRRTGATRS